MGKMGVLGFREQVEIFRALGADTVFAETPEEARRAFADMVKKDYAVICCAQRWHDALRVQIEACADRPLPAVVLLGGGEKTLEAAMQRAVGAQIQ